MARVGPATIDYGPHTTHITRLVCACGDDDLFAVEAGREGEDAVGLFPIRAGTPDRAWCFPCWARRFGVEDTLKQTTR